MNRVLRRPLPKGVAEWPWNQWPNAAGMGGRISVESVAECARNTQVELSVREDALEYHLNLLCNDARILTMDTRSMAGSESEPDFKNIRLTWQGNDFLDAIADEKAWKKVKKALGSGAKVATVEALKQVAKGAGAAGLAIILAENESDVIGIAQNPVTGSANETLK